MIETGKKYKLKKIRSFENSNNEYYRVVDFYNLDTMICESFYGESFVFMKEFLIDSQKPDDIYSILILERKELYDRKRLCTLWNKGFKLKDSRNRLADLYLEK